MSSWPVSVCPLGEGRRPSRTVYAITDAGLAGFERLLRETWANVEPQSFAFGIALTFVEALPVEEAASYLQQRVRQVEDAVRGPLKHESLLTSRGHMSEYLIEYQPEVRKLAVWSERRLPFEPTGRLREMRDELRLALRGMAATPSEVLVAQYYCQDDSFFDVENVLFYNVGTGAFRGASRCGLRFQRFTHLPYHPNPGFRHFQTYAFLRHPEALTDAERPCLALRFKMPKLNTATKPHEIWWHARTGLAEGDLPEEWDRYPYTLSLAIATSTPKRNWATYTKPLIDGVIASLNYQPVSGYASQAASLIAQALSVGHDRVLGLLSGDETGLRTPRGKLVAPYGDFVKWNPADDVCFSAELIPVLSSDDHVSVQAWLQSL